MPSSTLIRRKAQLELLNDACESRRPARIALRDAAGGRQTFETHLVALDDEGVWIEYPDDVQRRPDEIGSPADVFFDHDGSRYGFTTRAWGRERRRLSERHESWAMRLSLPPLVEQRQQREHFRISLATFDEIAADFVQVVGGVCVFNGRMLNLSCGGIASLSEWDDVRDLVRGDVFRVHFTLPGDPDALEFAVRLAHRRRVRDSLRAVLGWSFCPSDDHAETRRMMDRVRQFVTQRQRSLLKSVTAR